ncbi:hypothetical protein [Methylovirgula sp. HY1]|jgi:diphthamide synthase subunit DPH2|uniref:hypothetical protein n=1 Tax=Methylovirgula sp. HY1 TaxID=2822761 RepID=UPI001C5BCC4C|nr:hypothetical protein [Methylovirgula sp. HY1]QXX74690.1 hypothetical protein MHY1_01506 [Methylovirgula sp. HY1]
MQQRLKSLQRLLSVQKDLHRLAEWRLAALARRFNALQEEQKRLITYLDDDRLFTLAYTATIAGRLRVLEETKQRCKQERDEQTRILLQRSQRMGQIAHATEAVAKQCRLHEERRELDAAIDAAINSRRASLR